MKGPFCFNTEEENALKRGLQITQISSFNIFEKNFRFLLAKN